MNPAERYPALAREAARGYCSALCTHRTCCVSREAAAVMAMFVSDEVNESNNQQGESK